MWIDAAVPGLGLTAGETFFASCWFNFVHEHSLDSHRVRTMNPSNIVRELRHILNSEHANPSDREMVVKEAVQVLSSDPTLSAKPFETVTKALVKQLRDYKRDRDDDTPMIGFLAPELFDAIGRNYLRESFDRVRRLIQAIDAEPNNADHRRELVQTTNYLVSTLIDGGASLESVFQLYRHIIIPRKVPPKYTFKRALSLVEKITTQPVRKHLVLFAIENVTNAGEFPKEMGGIKFSQSATDWSHKNPAITSYLTENSRRLFAELETEARDVRTAGIQGYSKIGSVFDLVRFEYERERVHLAEEFLIRAPGGAQPPRRFPIPKVVPNPVTPLATLELTAFVTSVDGLLSSRSFSAEGRDRVLSAFRLYRQGADTNAFANKITSWWTAVEYLVRGVKGGKSIGTAVEQSLAPVLCLSYFPDLLADVRHALDRLVVDISSDGSGTTWKELPLHEVCTRATSADAMTRISTSLQPHPYLAHVFVSLLGALANANSTLLLLAAHEQRVRWQIQRLWRARSDIVHSAKQPISDVLLAANLEFYLKTTLTALLAELRSVPTLSSPEEFFARKAHWYKQLTTDLGSGTAGALIANLKNCGQ